MPPIDCVEKSPDGALHIEPKIPRHWPRYHMRLRDGDTTWAIEVQNGGTGCHVRSITIDGVAAALPAALDTRDGRVHQVLIELD